MSNVNRDYISAETCERMAELCRLRYGRLMNIQEQILFETLEKLCLQAKRYADSVNHPIQKSAPPMMGSGDESGNMSESTDLGGGP